MLADTVRTKAFAEALAKAVRRGETTVADIGAGTGILSFLALNAGAKKCHLYEHGDVLRLAKKLAAENGMERRCVFVHGHSLEVKNPPKADLVISETLGNFAYEEHIIENMDDAKRFLKPGGVMMPCAVRQFVAPVVSDRLWKELTVWRGVGQGLSFGAAEVTTFNNVYVRTVKPEDLLPVKGSIREWDCVRFPGKNASVRKGTPVWTIDASVTIHAFAVWWEADLTPEVTLSTAPSAPATHWEQILLPLRTPLDLKNGDTLELHLQSDSRWQAGINVQWRAVHKRGSTVIADQAYDMKKGML